MQISFALLAACTLVILLARQYLRENAKRADQGRVLFDKVFGLFDDPHIQREQTVGVWTLVGRYRQHMFQFKTVADTLATRKLPSLWLMVTLPEPQPVLETTDMMMRAAGISSFSNFDFLPHTLKLPKGFPEQATVRSDMSASGDMLSLMSSYLDIFHNGRGKEFLVSPKGLRIVVQLGEGDRARYGVFREANFEGTTIDMEVATQIMDALINLRKDILENAKN